MEEERNIITFFCFNGANGHGVGKSEMVYSRLKVQCPHPFSESTKYHMHCTEIKNQISM